MSTNVCDYCKYRPTLNTGEQKCSKWIKQGSSKEMLPCEIKSAPNHNKGDPPPKGVVNHNCMGPIVCPSHCSSIYPKEYYDETKDTENILDKAWSDDGKFQHSQMKNSQNLKDYQVFSTKKENIKQQYQDGYSGSVPGELKFQARKIVTAKLNNGGFNCISAQVVIMPEN